MAFKWNYSSGSRLQFQSSLWLSLILEKKVDRILLLSMKFITFDLVLLWKGANAFTLLVGKWVIFVKLLLMFMYS